MNYYYGPSFNDYFRRLVQIRLGDEYTFIEVCGAFENEGVFITVKDAQDAKYIYTLIEGELELVDCL